MVPCYCAGTGAEVTKNAVLLSPEHGVKVSLRSEFMIPAVALVDPELTVTTPAAVTRRYEWRLPAGSAPLLRTADGVLVPLHSCGLDAFTQCLEPFVSHLATPVTDGKSSSSIWLGFHFIDLFLCCCCYPRLLP